MKQTSAINDYVYPVVEKGLSKHLSTYMSNLQEFFKMRSKSIYDIGPYDRIVYGVEDINNFFKAIQVNKNDVLDGIKKTYYWQIAAFNPRAAKDELTVTSMMCIRYFLIKNDMKKAEISSIYLAFSGKFYPSIHSQIFPYPPSQNRHVMDYVINNMLTNKYDLKREGSLFGAMKCLCRTWLDTYKDKIINGDDEDFKDIIQQLHGRIKSMIGNIRTLFDKAYEEGHYLSYDSDSEDQDSYRVADNNSLQIERYVENTMNYINTNAVNYTICKQSSDSNVKVDEIKSIIEGIQDDNKNIPIIKELIRIIITEYVVTTNNKDIISYNFIAWAISAKPNSKNKNIIREKEIIESWLDENSSQYRKRKSRAATKSSYNKAIIKYYSLIIVQANK